MFNEEIMKFFAKYIESQLGITYVEANYFQLEHRLKDISTQLGFAGVDELYQKAKLSIEGQMKSLILDLSTNNETSFFRDGAIFKCLSRVIVPEILSKQSYPSLKIWSAASSSGQEAYSILMELAQARITNPSWPEPYLLASDVSDTILKRAQNAVYTQLEVQRGLPARLLVQYFEKEGEMNWKIKEDLKKNVEYRKINLLDNWAHIGPFDIVFCRNVLIYQSVENKKRVIEKIHDLLTPNGVMVLGAAESLFGISDRFKQRNEEGAVFYQKQ